MERRGTELTDKQRRWIRDRDDNRCNFPLRWDTDTGVYSRCGRRYLTELHVHHIVPYSWASRRLGWEPDQINRPTNLITLCKDCHFRKIHAVDMLEIFQVYRDDKKAFEKMFERRRKLTENGTPYWDIRWDEVMQRIANSRTEGYAELVAFPERRIRRLVT